MVILITAVMLVLAYTYLGYPLLAGLLARVRPQAVAVDPAYTPTVSACIPVFNAAGYVEAKLRSLQELDYPSDRLEILLYSDGSTDDSLEIAGRLAAEDPRIRVMGTRDRRGKPSALNEMIASACGQVLLLTDIRQPLAPGALRALTAKLADPEVCCVSGNLVLRGSSGAGFYWRYENWIRKQEARFGSMLGVSGPLYAVRAADVPQLPEDVILDDMWIPMRMRLHGKRIVLAEDAVAVDDAFDDDREFGRKVRTLAGNFQLLLLLPGLLNPFSNPSFFEFISHKILRLICPLLLVVLFGATTHVALGGRSMLDVTFTMVAVVWVAQVIFYLLAAFPKLGGKAGTIARSFAVLNLAVVVGLSRFLRGAQRVTW
jgi:cellulose synthase/poly-beta-1,6-N-acetylglucosamine synthase-like glycosyltransferase